MLLIPYFKYWRFVLIIVSIFIIGLSCKPPTKTTPENTQELADCSAPGLTYNQPDSTSCICIDNAKWNVDSTACECNNIFSFNSDSTICVMDTTSHDFTWVIDTLGGDGSDFNDVAIIDEDNVWVVGKIYTDSGSYNAAQWNGNEWKLIRITPPNSNIISDIQSIYSFSENDIWFGAGTLPVYYNGEMYYQFTPAIDDYPGGFNINAIWGTSSSDIYFVGDFGSIVHYDGTSFVQMETQTDERLLDIWGIIDARSEETVVWASGFSDSNGSVLLRLDETGWTKVYEILPPPPLYTIPNQLSWVIKSVWTDNVDSIYSASAGRIYHIPRFYEGNALENFWHSYSLGEAINSAPSSYRLRGNSRNDIFVVGFWCNVQHYNGKNWQSFEELRSEGSYYSAYKSVDVHVDFVVCVGEYGANMFARNAIVARGYR